MKRIAAAWVLLSCMAGWTVQAEPPAEIDYQGKVLVNDLPFTGDGRFKFAIANEDGSLNHWANDGTAAGEPSGILTNSVFNGVFSTVLGASSMSPTTRRRTATMRPSRATARSSRPCLSRRVSTPTRSR